MDSVSAAKSRRSFVTPGTPLADQVPADWEDKVMHGSLLGDQVLMGADVAPDRYENRGFSLSLQIENATDAERIFRGLSQGGRVVVPLEQTFWAARFGMVVDRFGIPWFINCDGSDQPTEGVTRMRSDPIEILLALPVWLVILLFSHPLVLLASLGLLFYWGRRGGRGRNEPLEPSSSSWRLPQRALRRSSSTSATR